MGYILLIAVDGYWTLSRPRQNTVDGIAHLGENSDGRDLKPLMVTV